MTRVKARERGNKKPRLTRSMIVKFIELSLVVRFPSHLTPTIVNRQLFECAYFKWCGQISRRKRDYSLLSPLDPHQLTSPAR